MGASLDRADTAGLALSPFIFLPPASEMKTWWLVKADAPAATLYRKTGSLEVGHQLKMLGQKKMGWLPRCAVEGQYEQFTFMRKEEISLLPVPVVFWVFCSIREIWASNDSGPSLLRQTTCTSLNSVGHPVLNPSPCSRARQQLKLPQTPGDQVIFWVL